MMRILEQQIVHKTYEIPPMFTQSIVIVVGCATKEIVLKLISMVICFSMNVVLLANLPDFRFVFVEKF